MAKLVADKVRVEHGLTINEKIIPCGARWIKTYGGFKVGNLYKADRKLSGGTGIVKGITIHNTTDIKNVEEDAEQYTRATYPNQNMGDARVHYFVDDINAWQNLREDEVGWHAGDGVGDGNETTIAIEVIMDGSGSKEDIKAEDNGALLAAILLVKHNLTIDKMYPHKKWSGKQCPLYILPHWDIFKAKVEANIKVINEEQKKETGSLTHIMGTAKATVAQMVAYVESVNKEPKLPNCSLKELAELFISEGVTEGVRGDIAWVQSCKETGFFRYGGIVLPKQNNYSGIGALNGNSEGNAATFSTPILGVRAQIQHLKAYASKDALVNDCVDPRFKLVTRGTAEFVEWLGAVDNPNGKGWAYPGKGYGDSIVKLLTALLSVRVENSQKDWKEQGFDALVEKGVITDKAYWKKRMNENITVGDVIGLLGKTVQKI